MTDFPFLGMRSTDDFVAFEDPQDWRQEMLRQDPNGDLILTGLLSMTQSEVTTSADFNWWTKVHPGQRAAVTGVYTNSGLSTAYSNASKKSSGDTVYVKMSSDNVSQFRSGHMAMLRDASDLNLDTVGYVTGTYSNGASSYVALQLIEDDDNQSGGGLANADTILIVGNANPEGAEPPQAVVYKPSKQSNITQIWQNTIDITRTAMKTRLRTTDVYEEARMDAMLLHGIEMEKSLLFGVKYETTGANGQPLRFTQGIIPWIKANSTETVSHYGTSSYSGTAWLEGGIDWLEEQLEILFRYGSSKRMAIAGTGALLQIQRLVRHYDGASFELTPSTRVFGFNIREWITPYGTIQFVTHPLFSHEVTTRNSMLLLDPKNIKWRPLQGSDTDHKVLPVTKDGISEVWITEGGYEFHFANEFGWLTGFGGDTSGGTTGGA